MELDTKMKIKALAPWFGSKRNLAPIVVDLIGKHRVYWEPFCGSMSVLLAKPPCEMETVNDLHGDLINLAKVIRDKDLAFKLYDKLSRTLYSEQLFRESKERWISGGETAGEPDINRAYDYFVASWMGLNGVSGTKRTRYQFAVRWCIGGGQGARRWRSVIDSMPAWHKRLQNVVIIKRDAFKILHNIRDEDFAVVYCDPPYFNISTKYIYNFEDEEHTKLAELLSRFKKTRVLVSYYDHPKLEELYKGWCRAHIKENQQSLGNATSNKRAEQKGPEFFKQDRKHPKEVLLINWKPEKTGLFE